MHTNWYYAELTNFGVSELVFALAQMDNPVGRKLTNEKSYNMSRYLKNYFVKLRLRAL